MEETKARNTRPGHDEPSYRITAMQRTGRELYGQKAKEYLRRKPFKEGKK